MTTITVEQLYTILINSVDTVMVNGEKTKFFTAPTVLSLLQRLADEDAVKTFDHLVGMSLEQAFYNRSHMENEMRYLLWIERVNGKWHPEFVKRVRIWAAKDDTWIGKIDDINADSPDYIMNRFKRPTFVRIRLDRNDTVVSIEGIILA